MSMSKLVRAGAAVHGFLYRRGLARKMGQTQTVLLTTTGHKTGRSYTVALGAVPEGDGKARMQEITNPADRDRIWHNVVASGKGYANYPKKTSRVIPLGLLRPVS
jgi:hypothetical protein